MKKSIYALLIVFAFVNKVNAQWQQMGNTLQRTADGYSYRTNLGSPGFAYWYTKSQIDSLSNLYNTKFILNGTLLQSSSNFHISGNGTFGSGTPSYKVQAFGSSGQYIGLDVSGANPALRIFSSGGGVDPLIDFGGGNTIDGNQVRGFYFDSSLGEYHFRNSMDRLTVLSNGNVGISNSAPQYPFSVTPFQYSTGTVSRSGNVITGVGTTFTSDMVGSHIVYGTNGDGGLITGFIDATHLNSSVSGTLASQTYIISYNALNVNSTGHILLGIAPTVTTGITYNLVWDPATLEIKQQSTSSGSAVWGGITGTLSNQTDLQNALNLKANLASPSLTGVPTAPTASFGTNTTQLATTAFIQSAIAGITAPTLQSVTNSGNTTTNNIGIGTTSPLAALHVATSSSSTPRGILADQNSSDAVGSRITMRKSRGTQVSPTVITTGDVLGSWTAAGHDGTNYIDAAKVLITSAGTISTGIVPSTMQLQTMNSSGTLTTGINIDQSQNLTFNHYTTNGLLKTSGGTGLVSIATAGTDYQIPISLTTTGTSGAATFNTGTGVLNIPNYAGGVTSVSNSDGTINISPTTGAVVVSLATGHANNWTQAQTITNVNAPQFSLFYDATHGHTFSESSTGDLTINAANAGTTSFTTTANSNTPNVANFFAANTTTNSTPGHGPYFQFGVSNTTNNAATFQLQYVGNGSSSNYAAIGLNATAAPLNIWADRVAIGTTTKPGSANQLVVNGNITGNSLTSSGTINFGGLTASKIVFTDASKNLTSTAPGTVDQYFDGTGALQTMHGLVRASNDFTGLTSASSATITSYTPASTGNYEISAYCYVTAVTGGLTNIYVSYTDQNNNSQTAIFYSQGSTVSNITTLGATEYPPFIIRAKGGTAITVLQGATGTITFDAGATIKTL